MERELLQLLSDDLPVLDRESVFLLLKYFRGQSFLLHYFERLFFGRSIGSGLIARGVQAFGGSSFEADGRMLAGGACESDRRFL